MHWDGVAPAHAKTRSGGRFTRPCSYVTTITRPQPFRAYLAEQLAMLKGEYAVTIEVTASRQEISFPYVIEGDNLTLDRSMSDGITQYFPTTEPAQIGEETAEGLFQTSNRFPLSHFDALRTDFSLARRRHDTGTLAEHFQPYLLLTNYTRYVNEFVRWARQQIDARESRKTSKFCNAGVNSG